MRRVMRFDGGESGDGCRSVWMGFVVAVQAAGVYKPAVGKSDDPAAGGACSRALVLRPLLAKALVRVG